MPRVIFRFLLLAIVLATPLRAVEMNDGYNSTAPVDSSGPGGIPNWSVGWGASNVTGWDYVGTVNGCSGVYLGNGWVLTAGHVGAGTFTLTSGPGAGTYNFNGTSRSISDAHGTADLTLFQISKPPTSLPNLILSTGLPVAFSATQAGSSVAMLGFGGGHGLTWGLDIVTETDQLLTPGGYTYVSNDFTTDDGQVNRGSSSITNNSTLVGNDSGGGNFTYNSVTSKWELTGINEVVGSYDGYDPVANNYSYGNGNFSGMVQLDTYASQINDIVSPPGGDTPTMPPFALLVLAGLLIFVSVRSLGTKDKPMRVR